MPFNPELREVVAIEFSVVAARHATIERVLEETGVGCDMVVTTLWQPIPTVLKALRPVVPVPFRLR